MENFIDDVAEITWYKDDLSYDANQLNSELDSWKSDEIEEFVTGGTDLGYTLRGITMFADRTEQFYGFIDGKLVSSILLRDKEMETSLQYDLLTHIQNKKRGLNFVEGKSLSVDKAFELIDTPRYGEVSYLVVKPEEKGKGYGTRIISSIKNNMGIFLPNNSLDAFCTTINCKNTPSIKAFYKNGLKPLNLKKDDLDNLNKFFLEEELEK